MPVIAEIMTSPEQPQVNKAKSAKSGAEGKNSGISARNREESEFLALYKRLVEEPKEKEQDRPELSTDLWSQLVLLFPQLATVTGNEEVITGPGQEILAAIEGNSELLTSLTEVLTSAEVSPVAEETTALEGPMEEQTASQLMTAEALFNIKDEQTTALISDDPLAEAVDTPESDGTFSGELIAELKGAEVGEQSSLAATRPESNLDRNPGSEYQDSAGMDANREIGTKADRVVPITAEKQDFKLALNNESGTETEFSGEAVKVSADKTEIDPFINPLGGVDPTGAPTLEQPTATEVTFAPGIPKEELAAQIVSGAKLMVKNGVTKVQIQLEPAELGKLELSLVIERDLVAARFVTETQGVQSLIESNLPHLRSSLEEAGLSVDLLQVAVQTGGDPQMQNQTTAGGHQFQRHTAWGRTTPEMLVVEENVLSDEAWHGMVNLRV